MGDIDWDELEGHERWADTVANSVKQATEDQIDYAVHLKKLCPVCGGRYLDNDIIEFTGELAHKTCFVGFLALHRSTFKGPPSDGKGSLESDGNVQSGSHATAKGKHKGNKGKIPWPGPGTLACERWLLENLPTTLVPLPPQSNPAPMLAVLAIVAIAGFVGMFKEHMFEDYT